MGKDFECPDCGERVRSFAGHVCRAGKSSTLTGVDAGGNVTRVSTVQIRGGVPSSDGASAGSARPVGEERKATQAVISKAALLGSSPSANVAPAPSETIKRGRPRIEDRGKTLAATKPWEAEGMSRATWYSRRKTTKGEA